MVDLQTVCCMCGDVGFSDKLFRCSNCHNRYQHSYCSNYYSQYEKPIEICDWCQSEQRSSLSSSSSSNQDHFASNYSPWSNKSIHANEQSANSGDKIKRQDREKGGSRAEKATKKTPSPRPAIRRYKLLKDVMC